MHEASSGRVFPAIVFTVRGGFYAFEQRGTANLLPWLQRYTPPSAAPGLPDWCLGLLNVRGTLQMVVDLGALLGLGFSEVVDRSRLIFLEHGDAQIGLLVDTEIGVRYLRPSDDASLSLGGQFATYSALLESQLVTVLDGAAVILAVARELRAPAYLS